jgi:two-component system chemotaxis sensor kinase CheA
MDRDRILVEFQAEAAENIADLESALLSLEKGGDVHAALRTLLRKLHNLKGNASVLGFPELEKFAHLLEDCLVPFADTGLPGDTVLISLLLQALDSIRELVRGSIAGQSGSLPFPMVLIEAIARKVSGEEALAGDDPQSGGSEQDPTQQRLQTVRVSVERLDMLLDLASEITISSGRLQQLVEKTSASAGDELLAAQQTTAVLYRNLQEQLLRLRLVPIGPLLNSLMRPVRDLATECGKNVSLSISGEEVEVDASVIGQLRDPLIHMIRNAIGHGIESPSDRRAAGKPEAGKLVIEARHDAGSIRVRVADDGRGFNAEKIRRRAIERGLLRPDEHLANETLFQFVFETGFSTTDEANSLSGRGVGMDVVKKNAESLHGTVHIESDPGAGSAISLLLPLTVAILDGFAVGVAGETFLIPMRAVEECLDLPAEHFDGDSEGLLNLRGEPMPFLRLRGVFGLSGQTAERENVLIVRHGERRSALAVDSLFGETQAVIKPLGKLFGQIPGVSGSTILGNGRVALILDVDGLFAAHRAARASLETN